MVASAGDASAIQVARAIKCRGLLLSELGRFHEALEAYESLIDRFGASSEPALTEQVAMALIEKGETLFELHRPDEARRAYEQVIERFEEAADPEVRREVGRARNILYLRRRTLGSEPH
jgi:tetratricopeptide (TPR) repeat protein